MPWVAPSAVVNCMMGTSRLSLDPSAVKFFHCQAPFEPAVRLPHSVDQSVELSHRQGCPSSFLVAALLLLMKFAAGLESVFCSVTWYSSPLTSGTGLDSKVISSNREEALSDCRLGTKVAVAKGLPLTSGR